MVTTQRQGGDLETRAAKRPMRHQSYDVLWFLALHSFLAPDLPVSSCRYSFLYEPYPIFGNGCPVFLVACIISFISTCCISTGNSYASRDSGLSNFSDILYSSKRPSAACAFTRSRNACIS